MKSLVLVLMCAFISKVQAQKIPEWYLKEIASDVGIWVTDNSKYLNEQEPIDHYAIEWELAPTKTVLSGRMYGMKDGKEIGSYWTFKKYWDIEKGAAILEQIALDGTRGVGPYKVTGEYSNELIQEFTRPDGSTWTAGHRTVFLSAFRNIGTSYTIDSDGHWTEERTYTWIKQLPNLDIDALRPLEFMVGKWHATPADSSFRSIMTYEFNEGKNLLITTNQFFDQEGNELGTYEGAYYSLDGQLGYYLTGPEGEVQIGKFEPKSDQVIHKSTFSPRDNLKINKSIMEFKLGKLYYHTNYFSSGGVVPEHVPYNSPLIYLKLDKE